MKSNMRKKPREVLVSHTCCVVSDKLEVVVLIPMFQGEIVERCSISKLQVSKMPIQNLTILR